MIMSKNYKDAHIVVSAKDGTGIIHQSEMTTSYKDAEEQAKEYATSHPEEVVMVCKPIAIVETTTKLEVTSLNK
jgi:adenosyl cobinamide kinase/adenosyl cobinamide phosphate guanylyltransferase